MLSYNLSTVTAIKVLKKKVSRNWKYVPAHAKFFGLIKYPNLFYDNYAWKREGQEKCPSNYYLEDGVVIEEPHVIMWFSDGDNRKFYFKTPEEAVVTAEDVKKRSGCQWYEHK